MKATVVRPGELGASEIAAWCAMQPPPGAPQPVPLPAFLQAVSRVRPDTRVAVLQDGPRLVGFFPFQQRRMRIALPLATGVSDGQAIVHVPGLEWDPVELMAACNLDVWEFDHLLSAQLPLVQSAARQRPQTECARVTRRDSPIIDVSRGFEAYAEQQRRSTRRSFRTTLYKERKLGREVGPVGITLTRRTPTRSASSSSGSRPSTAARDGVTGSPPAGSSASSGTYSTASMTTLAAKAPSPSCGRADPNRGGAFRPAVSNVAVLLVSGLRSRACPVLARARPLSADGGGRGRGGP